MRIETARDTDHQQRPRTSPGKAADQPAKRRLFHQTEPQAQARGQATRQLRTQKKRPGNTEHEKAIRQQKMRNNRPAMHYAPALGASSQFGASPLPSAPSLSSNPKTSATQASSPTRLSTKGSAPAKKHPQPPRNSTSGAHFSRKTAERKVTHITNKFFKTLILILLMETPEAPKREKSPKPCHIRTYSVIILPKS